MSFQLLIQSLTENTGKSLLSFQAELALCGTIVLMLLARLPRAGRKLNSFYIALPGTLVALYLAAPWVNLPLSPGELLKQTVAQPFDGLLVYDGFAIYFRSVLLIFLVFFLLLTRLSGIPDREDSPDFYTLVLGGVVGMCLMVSANHLLVVFLGVEMASVPSYALAGMLKGRRKSSEAALKYAVYGAGASGVMLYGISLLGGILGTVHLPTMALQLATTDVFAERQTVLMMGGLMIAVGLAFKLSAVPFHFWCPDVFEGASAEVNAYLSVASKAAALALLTRVAVGFSHVPASAIPESTVPEVAAISAAQVASPTAQTVAFRAAIDDPAGEHAPESPSAALEGDTPPTRAELNLALAPARRYIVGLITLIAALTSTFGNLAAYGQTNIKRLLAYSTIAHAGYMIMPVAAAVALLADRPELAEEALASLAFYVATYLFMNLGAFAVVAFLRNAMRSEEIADYAGLIRRCPGVVICFSIMLVSLIGLPPLAGFPAKMMVFYYLVPAQLYLLLIIGGLNTVLSLFYYLRVVKVMALDPEPLDRLPVRLSLNSLAGVYIVLVTLPVLIWGVWFDPLNQWARAAVEHLLS